MGLNTEPITSIAEADIENTDQPKKYVFTVYSDSVLIIRCSY